LKNASERLVVNQTGKTDIMYVHTFKAAQWVSPGGFFFFTGLFGKPSEKCKLGA
jgi:hypothetical protein